MFCKNCGNEIQEDWSVCPNCGIKLKEENEKRNQDNEQIVKNVNHVHQNQNTPKKKKSKLKKVGIIIIAIIIIYILFQIPESSVTDIGKPSTDPDDYYEGYDYKPIDNSTQTDANDSTEQMSENDTADNIVTDGSSFAANSEEIPVKVTYLECQTATYSDGSSMYFKIYVDNTSGKEIRTANFWVYFYDKNGMPIIVNTSDSTEPYLYSIMADNITEGAGNVEFQYTIPLNVDEIGYIGLILDTYSAFDGTEFKNTYADEFRMYSGAKVEELQAVASGCVMQLTNIG